MVQVTEADLKIMLDALTCMALQNEDYIIEQHRQGFTAKHTEEATRNQRLVLDKYAQR